jgi:hypothetical protein
VKIEQSSWKVVYQSSVKESLVPYDQVVESKKHVELPDPQPVPVKEQSNITEQS